MSTRSSIWRRRLGLWLPALVFFLLNLGALVVYQTRFAGRAEVTQEELQEARRELSLLQSRHRRVATQLERARSTRAAVGELYERRLATESERLTDIIAEVKELASRAGMTPRSISYPSEAIEDYGLRKRSLVFQVEGRYSDLRKFINLLELSESFLTLEEVSLSGASGGNQLTIRLRLSTLFASGEQPPLETS